MSTCPMDRRTFLAAGGSAAAGLLSGPATPAVMRRRPPTPQDLPRRALGRTAAHVSLLALGGRGALARADNEAAAVAIIERALDLGVSYIDTAVAWGRGASQRYIGQVMARRREGVFLASRTADRTSEGCCEDLDRALRDLRTDHLDLWQIDDVTTIQDVNRICAPGGALEGFRYGKEQRQTRHIGVTGVKDARVLMELLRRAPDVDTVMIGINAADPHIGSFAAELVPFAVERNTGIIATHVTAEGRLLTTFVPGPGHASEPGGPLVPGPLTLEEALSYVLSLPVATAVAEVESVAEVEEYARLARAFTPLAPAALRDLAERTRPVARQCLYMRTTG